MALTRRSVQRVSGSIWPGFVDAMTALLLVLMFVLTIFMVVQYVLREQITGQEDALEQLNAEINVLARALGLEQQTRVGLEDDLALAREESAAQSSLIANLTTQIETQADELASRAARLATFEDQVTALLAERDSALARGEELTADVAALEEAERRLITEQEAMQLALASARDEIDAQAEAARLAAARRDALQALAADLRSELEERDTALAAAQSDLSDEEAARLAEAAAAEALRDRLRNADAELTAMTLALEEQRRQAEETLTLLAAAQARANSAEADVAAQLSEAERQAALLAVARSELAEEAALSEESQRRVALLNQQTAALRAQLGALQSLLDEAEARDADAQVRIETLGSQLNVALARAASEGQRRAELEEAERIRLEEEARRLAAEAQELERYRSDFFGAVREVIEGREGVQIVGDRFVFSSEVLFETGSAALSSQGRFQIAGIVQILSDVARDIPDEIDWILRVDGHTDNIPISGGAFADNWELSQARALSVVRYMVDVLGFPPDRLAAAGFGEYRPVNPADTAAARAQNRRIELKLTER